MALCSYSQQIEERVHQQISGRSPQSFAAKEKLTKLQHWRLSNSLRIKKNRDSGIHQQSGSNMLDLRFSQQWLSWVLSFGMWHRLIWQKFTDVSEEHAASETSADFYRTTRHYITEDRTLQFYSCYIHSRVKSCCLITLLMLAFFQSINRLRLNPFLFFKHFVHVDYIFDKFIYLSL